MTEQAIAAIKQVQRPIIAVGGTSLYIRALLEGLFDGPPADPQIRQELKQRADNLGCQELHKELASIDKEAAQRIHANDLKRIVRALEVYKLTGKPISSFQQQFRSGHYRYPWTLIGLKRDKEDANHRINIRVKKMIEQGLVDEVKKLLADPQGLSAQAAQAVGYAEIISYIEGKYSLDEAFEQIKINTRRLAKAQRTWFRSFSDVNWFDLSIDETVEGLANRIEQIF